VALFVGGIFLFVFHQVGNSDAAAVARSFLRSNERLKQDIGEVRDFGWFITGNINIQNSGGTATLNLRVIGMRKTVHATVDLIYRSGKEWRVTSAVYTNEAGKTIELFNPYESNLRVEVSPSFKFRISNLRSQIADLKSQI
jgi:hypothetical protein